MSKQNDCFIHLEFTTGSGHFLVAPFVTFSTSTHDLVFSRLIFHRPLLNNADFFESMTRDHEFFITIKGVIASVIQMDDLIA